MSKHIDEFTESTERSTSPAITPSTESYVIVRSLGFNVYEIWIYVYSTCGTSTGDGYRAQAYRWVHRVHRTVDITHNIPIQQILYPFRIYVYKIWIYVYSTPGASTGDGYRVQAYRWVHRVHRTVDITHNSPIQQIFITSELMFTRSEFMFTACVGAPRVMVSCPGMSLSSLTSAQPSTAPRMSSGSKTHIVSESRIYVYIIDVYSKILHGTQNQFLTFLFYTSQEH